MLGVIRSMKLYASSKKKKKMQVINILYVTTYGDANNFVLFDSKTYNKYVRIIISMK
jgi:hypothetical protein